MKPIRIAVVGVGRLGRIHARLLQSLPQAELVGLVEPNPSARADAAAEFGVPALADLQQLSGQIDAAIVAATTTSHHQTTLDLLRQQIHVFVEKPLTPTAAQARQLVAEAQARRCVLQVGHVERFNPALHAAMPHLQQPCYIEARRMSGYTCRSIDVGVVLDLMIHDLDIVLSLAAAPLVDIQAVGAPVFGPYEDMAQVRLAFANGCIANLTASRVSPLAERSMHVYQRDCVATIDFAQKSASLISRAPQLHHGLDVAQLDEPTRQRITTRLFDDFLPRHELPVVESNAILEQQREFLTCIIEGTQPTVSGQTGCRVVEVAERIQQQIAAYLGAFDEPRILPVPETLAPSGPMRQAG